MTKHKKKKNNDKSQPSYPKGPRRLLYDIIFGHDTKEGKAFDIWLIIAIFTSVLAVILDSVDTIHASYGRLLYTIEWFFTIVFTIEYLLRIISLRKPFYYTKSFFGIIDLIAILPTYISLFLIGAQTLLIIRILRLMRLFRILKMTRFITESNVLIRAIHGSLHKIIVFLLSIIIIVVIMGSMMYLIEGPENGFTNIPIGIYWAIVTVTTVGFGDIYPATAMGKFLASALMLIGYSIIAVPTGIFSLELSKNHKIANTKTCDICGKTIHDSDAKFCKHCGNKL